MEAPVADLSNWRTAPFNRWAFRNVPDLMPVARISRASDDVWALPTALGNFGDFALQVPGGATLSLPQVLDATATDGLVVLHDGKIVFEDYRNGLAPDAPHIIMSATKSITGLVAALLAQRGAVDLRATIAAIVPELAGTIYRDVTLQHLLDMRSGVTLNDAQLRAYADASGWEKPGPERRGLHAFYVEQAGAAVTPGGPFRYISANADLLGWALERATGKSFANLVSELLWQPIGMEADACITEDGFGAPRTTGGLCATARDLARLGQLLVQDGKRNGHVIVPPAIIADVENNGDAEAWKTGDFAGGFAGMTMRYRNGWYVVDSAPKMIFAMGIHGQNLFVDRSNRIVIAKLSSQGDALDYRAIGLTHLAVRELRRCLVA